MVRKSRSYRLQVNTIQKIDVLKKTLEKELGLKISATDVVEHAVNDVYEKYKKRGLIE